MSSNENTSILNGGGNPEKDIEAIRIAMQQKLEQEAYDELLSTYGIENTTLERLRENYAEYKKYKNIEANTWNTAWNSKSKVDFTTDINKAGDKTQNAFAKVESILTDMATTYYNNKRHAECVEAVNTLDAELLTDEVMETLKKEGIKPEEIQDPAKSKIFTMYLQMQELKVENQNLTQDNERLSQENKQKDRLISVLQTKYMEAYTKFKDFATKVSSRAKTNESRYVTAQKRISELSATIQELKSMGIVGFIKQKIRGFTGMNHNAEGTLPSGSNWEPIVNPGETGTVQSLKEVLEEAARMEETRAKEDPNRRTVVELGSK